MNVPSQDLRAPAVAGEPLRLTRPSLVAPGDAGRLADVLARQVASLPAGMVAQTALGSVRFRAPDEVVETVVRPRFPDSGLLDSADFDIAVLPHGPASVALVEFVEEKRRRDGGSAVQLPHETADWFVEKKDADPRYPAALVRVSEGATSVAAWVSDEHPMWHNVWVRGARQLLVAHAIRQGGQFWHGALVCRDGSGLMLAGAKHAGKTTIMLHLLRSHGFDLVSNDKVLAVVDCDSAPRLVGLPYSVGVWEETARGFPELPRCGATATGAYTRAYSGAVRRYFIESRDVAAAFGRRLREETRLAMLAVPRYDKDTAGASATKPIRRPDLPPNFFYECVSPGTEYWDRLAGWGPERFDRDGEAARNVLAGIPRIEVVHGRDGARAAAERIAAAFASLESEL